MAVGTGSSGPHSTWSVDGNGDVYVADTGNSRIQMFNSGGTYLTQWGTQGSGDGQFDYPVSVAVDGSGNVYVADRDNQRIQVFRFQPTPTTSSTWGRLKARYR